MKRLFIAALTMIALSGCAAQTAEYNVIFFDDGNTGVDYLIYADEWKEVTSRGRGDWRIAMGIGHGNDVMGNCLGGYTIKSRELQSNGDMRVIAVCNK